MLSYFEKQFAKEVDNLEACDMDIDENDVQENNSMHDSTTISLNNDSKAVIILFCCFSYFYVISMFDLDPTFGTFK